MGRVWEAIANLLFLDHFLASFWEPWGSHFRTFGSHLAIKRRLETNLVFMQFFYDVLTISEGSDLEFDMVFTSRKTFSLF